MQLPDDVSQENMLLLWLSLFKADTEEELEKIKGMEVPVMSQAINAYYRFNKTYFICQLKSNKLNFNSRYNAKKGVKKY